MLHFGPFCCAMLAVPPVPVRASAPWPEQFPAGPCSWSGGGRMWGQPPCQLRPHTGRSPQAVPTSAGEATCLLLHQWRVACCPYSCAKAVGLCPVLPPCPRGRMSVPGDAHEVVTISCSAQCGNSVQQHRRDILQVGKTQMVPKNREVRRCSKIVEAALPCLEECHHPFPLHFLCL